MPKKEAMTEAQREACRKNGALGGRPRNTYGIMQARRIRERAIALGRSQTMENLLFWLQVRDDGEAPLDARLRAAQEIEDRYGMPRQSANINMNVDAEPVKLFEIVAFEPPKSWNNEPPPLADVVEEKGENPDAKPDTNGVAH